MKRIISLLLVAALLVPLAACGGGSVETVSYTHLDVYKRQV